MDENKKIRILIKKPKEEAEIVEIEDKLENLQEIVGGLIDCTPLPGSNNIDIFFNDEGKIMHLDGNVWLAGPGGDCIVGTCYFVGYDSETGESVSLTDKQIKECQKYVKTFELGKDIDLYSDYLWLVPKMLEKSEKYLKKSFLEM